MWRTGGKGSGPRGQQAQRPVVAVTCLRTTQNSCGRRRGAEARSHGAFGPSEETSVYEAQWEGPERPLAGRDGTASGKRAALRPRARAPEPPAWLRPGLHLGPMSSPLRVPGSPLRAAAAAALPPRDEMPRDSARTTRNAPCLYVGRGRARSPSREEGMEQAPGKGAGKRVRDHCRIPVDEGGARGPERPRWGQRAAHGPRTRSGRSRSRSC